MALRGISWNVSLIGHQQKTSQAIATGIGDILGFFGPGHGNGKPDSRGQILVAIARVSIVKLLQFFRSALPIIGASLPLSNLLVPVLPDQRLFHLETIKTLQHASYLKLFNLLLGRKLLFDDGDSFQDE